MGLGHGFSFGVSTLLASDICDGDKEKRRAEKEPEWFPQPAVRVDQSRHLSSWNSRIESIPSRSDSKACRDNVISICLCLLRFAFVNKIEVQSQSSSKQPMMRIASPCDDSSVIALFFFTGQSPVL
jgi:hypothetical protein